MRTTSGSLKVGCAAAALRRGVIAVLAAVLLLHPSAVAGKVDKASVPPMPPETDMGELVQEPQVPPGRVTIGAPALPDEPESGKGRLALVFSGNRRWCTYPDDRMVRPPTKLAALNTPGKAVYTFGYKFTVAAVKRSDPDATLLFFESPTIRTAELRQAAKLGRGKKHVRTSPMAHPEPDGSGVGRSSEDPNSLVPYWIERNRCAKVEERFDFDLDAGTYDVYVAFDVLMRSGSWAHRSIGYHTDVVVEPGRRTRLEGVIDTSGGIKREVSLVSSEILPAEVVGGGGP